MELDFTKNVLKLAQKLDVISNADDFLKKSLHSSSSSGKLPVRLNLVTAYLMNFLLDIKK